MMDCDIIAFLRDPNALLADDAPAFYVFFAMVQFYHGYGNYLHTHDLIVLCDTPSSRATMFNDSSFRLPAVLRQCMMPKVAIKSHLLLIA